VVLLTVLVSASWTAAVVVPVLILRLLLGVDAPHDGLVTIVFASFLTFALLAAGLTVGLVILRRSRRSGARQPSP
jgi:NhaP-type Na+/H+ and K+/H+ antiporter